jgi:membrane associated rhomboid family serine protease
MFCLLIFYGMYVLPELTFFYCLCSLDVDWAAHLGGLIAGFASSFLCFAPKIKTKMYAVFWSVVGIVMNVSLYVVTINYMIKNVHPNEELNDVCAYYQQYFEGYECQCQLE